MIRHPRQGWRLRPAVAGLAAALLACALVAVPLGAVAEVAEDTTGDPAKWRLPTVVNAPGAWSEDENHPGPVAAIGFAERIVAMGISEERGLRHPFATSALDGSSSWLDLPGFLPERSGYLDGVAVSPDGRWLGWVRAVKGRAGRDWGGGAIKGWAVKDTITGSVRRFDVEGHPRVRSVMSELAFSGDSRHLLTSFETLDTPRRGNRNHQFVAWSVADGTPVVLEEPGFRWLPTIGHAEQGVVWSRKREVFRADPGTGRRSVVTLPREVRLASWAPGDAAFAYIGRDARKKGSPPPDEQLYVGATPATAQRVVDLPDTSPIGEVLAWRDATHVVVGNHRGGMYVVDVTDGSHEKIEMKGSGGQLNTPQLATDLWAAPLQTPVAQTGLSDPRSPRIWSGLVLFVALLIGGGVLLRRADRAAKDRAAKDRAIDTAAAVDRLPTSAWVMAWLFLGGQVPALMSRGVTSSDFVWVVVSMVLSAVVIRWFAAGVLRGRTVRLVVVWILLSALAAVGCVEVVVDAAHLTAADVVNVAVALAQLVALGVFCTTSYFIDRRADPHVSAALLAPLLLLAVFTGLLGGLIAPEGDVGTSMQLRVQL